MMFVFVASIVLTAVFYALNIYVSFMAASILYLGITFRKIVPLFQAYLFILITYISIISDVVMFVHGMHSSISVKNGLLLLLLVASLITARSRKGTD